MKILEESNTVRLPKRVKLSNCDIQVLLKARDVLVGLRDVTAVDSFANWPCAEALRHIAAILEKHDSPNYLSGSWLSVE